MSGKPVKPLATKNQSAAVGFKDPSHDRTVTQNMGGD
jgi:hypothetical protein